jgi:tetratricopeptide (TPR) repeat protein
VQRFPASARANFEYGFHLQKLGRVDEALLLLEKAMQTGPNYEEPFFFYGDILVRQGRSEKAIPYLKEAIRIRPVYLPARVALGRAHINLRQFDDAIRELDQAARDDPANAQPHVLLSQVYFRMGKQELARKAKETSLKLRRENPAALEASQPRPFPAN